MNATFFNLALTVVCIHWASSYTFDAKREFPFFLPPVVIPSIISFSRDWCVLITCPKYRIFNIFARASNEMLVSLLACYLLLLWLYFVSVARYSHSPSLEDLSSTISFLLFLCILIIYSLQQASVLVCCFFILIFIVNWSNSWTVLQSASGLSFVLNAARLEIWRSEVQIPAQVRIFPLDFNCNSSWHE